MDIKLLVPITDAKTMFIFSTLHKLHHKKLLQLAFSGQHCKISRLLQHLNSVSIQDLSEPEKSKECQEFSGPAGTLINNQEKYMKENKKTFLNELAILQKQVAQPKPKPKPNPTPTNLQ